MNTGDTDSQHHRNTPPLSAISAYFPNPTEADNQPDLTTQVAYLPTPRAAEASQSMTAPGARRHVEKGMGGLTEVIGARLLPTPKSSDSIRENSPADNRRNSPGLTAVDSHFPTPKASDGVMGRPRTSGRPIEKSTHPGTIVTLLPTPNTMDSLPAREGEARERQLHRGDLTSSRRRSMGNLREDIVHEDFGKYTPAVERWESVTGNMAPPPTELNTKGKPRLNAAFAEWMMGLPEGWVTSPEIGLTRAHQLKAIGNGVVPQQALAALQQLLKKQDETQHETKNRT